MRKSPICDSQCNYEGCNYENNWRCLYSENEKSVNFGCEHSRKRSLFIVSDRDDTIHHKVKYKSNCFIEYIHNPVCPEKVYNAVLYLRKVNFKHFNNQYHSLIRFDHLCADSEILLVDVTFEDITVSSSIISNFYRINN